MTRRGLRRPIELALPTLVAAAALCTPAATTASSTAAKAITCHGLRPTITGTSGTDSLTGTAGNDVIVGLGGADVIDAGPGDDVVCAGAGDDTIYGGDGNDLLSGEAGSDVFFPGPGNDKLEGGSAKPGTASDYVQFLSGPMHVDLAAGRASGEGEDVLTGIQAVGGSPADDTLIGNGQPNFLAGGEGNDLLNGNGGADVASFDRPVTANIAGGTSSGDGTDTLIQIEGLAGSSFRDTLTGDGASNYLAGFGGNDVVDGAGGDDRVFGLNGNDTVEGGSGDDVVDGGPGNDTLDGGGGDGDAVSYADSDSGVNVDLAAGTAVGDGEDRITSLEGVFGSSSADRIVGNDQPNVLHGGAGNDRMSGGGGADFVGGGGGTNTIDGGSGADYCTNGAGAGRCEISGVPGDIPGSAAKPPAIATSPQSFASTRVKLEAWATGSGGETRAPSPSPASSPFSAATRLLGEALADRFDLRGHPVCEAGRRPFATSITPPVRVDPIGATGTQHVSWRAELFKWKASAHRWTSIHSTAWATAQIAGGSVARGIPNWVDARGRAVGRVQFQVPSGRYIWGATLRWDQQNQSFYGFVEPHLVEPSRAPRKDCRFG